MDGNKQAKISGRNKAIYPSVGRAIIRPKYVTIEKKDLLR
jgi:hypothetical protein